ncbi:efflux RND transporter periplasmic adaptor subunit [Neptuniibacter sp. QD72_48]|uniref:efflux RND transporter periplasmic adaptor subunit n=1 Tax=unclassified Neptuniibacter TaxID=2630693 RepID=UPI0039F479E7
MNKAVLTLGALLVGTSAGYFLSQQKSDSADSSAPANDQPLYWVAPMDPNYKRDKPGLSPMGMDLVPVYEEDLAGGDSPGTISISPEVENNLSVRTEAVLFSPLQAQLKTVGYVGVDQERVTDIHSRIAGWVEQVKVSVKGEYVEKGSLLYEVYSPELVNAQEEYLAALRSGNRFLRKASESKLVALGVSKTVLSTLNKQRQPLQKLPVYAPVSGYIDQISLRKGTYIKPNSRLLTIAPLDQVWVTAELFERQGSAVQKGDVAEMTLAFMPGEIWRGQVDYVYPTVNQKTRTLNVRLRFDNPDLLLKPDMFAQISIQSAPTKPMLNVSDTAVIKTGDQDRIVLALGEGKYKSVEVKTGPSMTGRTAILQGLFPEDRVVTSAQFMLDSESSISSDFLRLTPPAMGLIDEVWVGATVEEIDLELRLLTIRHEAIREWKQDAMLMQVKADESLDLEALRNAGSVQIRLRGANMSDLQLTDFILPRPKAPESIPGGKL